MLVPESEQQMRIPKRTPEYHLSELRIALDWTDPRHINPPAVPRSHKILDVGCGAGQTLLAAYPDRVTFGIDIDYDAVKLGSSHAEQVRFACAAAESLPFADSSFDEVVARGALPYTSIDRSLQEIRRVLKDGGIAWMTLHPPSIPWRTAKRSNWKGKIHFSYIVLNSLCFHFLQRQFPYPGGRGYESFQTEHGIRRALEKAGFRNISVEKTGHFVVTAS
jgi:ubiquinone/menaquinone biosynthesis C-methylase UbiE